MVVRIFSWIAILGLTLGTLYAFEYTRVPCQQALTYSIGQFDARFGLSETEFRIAVAQAEAPWEAALGRNLFQYEAGALFPVNLIFDERQARTQESQKLEREWDAVQSKQTTIKGKFDVLSTELAKARQAYDASIASFEARLDRYNQRVAEWNQGDRLDTGEFDAIRSDAKKLKAEQPVIESQRLRVNALVTEVNRYAKEEEKVVERYNSRVEEFTEQYGTEGSFDQGVYAGQSIDIYQFDDRDHLAMVLVHELGHALGLGHVENPRSIMYPVMGEQDIQQMEFSKEDRAALTSVCSVTAWDLMLRDTREAWSLLSNQFSN